MLGAESSGSGLIYRKCSGTSRYGNGDVCSAAVSAGRRSCYVKSESDLTNVYLVDGPSHCTRPSPNPSLERRPYLIVRTSRQPES